MFTPRTEHWKRPLSTRVICLSIIGTEGKRQQKVFSLGGAFMWRHILDNAGLVLQSFIPIHSIIVLAYFADRAIRVGRPSRPPVAHWFIAALIAAWQLADRFAPVAAMRGESATEIAVERWGFVAECLVTLSWASILTLFDVVLSAWLVRNKRHTQHSVVQVITDPESAHAHQPD